MEPDASAPPPEPIAARHVAAPPPPRRRPVWPVPGPRSARAPAATATRASAAPRRRPPPAPPGRARDRSARRPAGARRPPPPDARSGQAPPPRLSYSDRRPAISLHRDLQLRRPRRARPGSRSDRISSVDFLLLPRIPVSHILPLILLHLHRITSLHPWHRFGRVAYRIVRLNEYIISFHCIIFI